MTNSSHAKTSARLLLAAAAIVGAAAVAWPLSRTFEVERRILAHQSAIDALANVARTDGGLTAPTASTLLITGESAGRASAELQQRLNAISAAIGLDVRSVQALPVKRRDNVIEVPVELTLLAETNSLAAYLLAVETGVPLIIVDELSVRTLPPVQGTAGTAPTRLEVALKAHGTAALGDAEKQP